MPSTRAAQGWDGRDKGEGGGDRLYVESWRSVMGMETGVVEVSRLLIIYLS
jgi:hypothetical protein